MRYQLLTLCRCIGPGFTTTVTVSVSEPVGPLAIAVKFVLTAAATLVDPPPTSTEPKPTIVTFVALATDHVSVVMPPFVKTGGSAVNESQTLLDEITGKPK